MNYIIAIIVLLVIAAGLFGWGLLSRKRLYGPNGHKRRPDIYVLAMNEKVKRHIKQAGFEGLTNAERICWSVTWLWRYVMLGDFENYYLQSEADYAIEAEDGFKHIGAEEFADIVRRANAIFESGRPARNKELREEQLGEFGKEEFMELNELSEEFRQCTEDWQNMMAEFIAKHREEFLRKL